MLAKDLMHRGVRLPALSLTTIASMPLLQGEGPKIQAFSCPNARSSCSR